MGGMPEAGKKVSALLVQKSERIAYPLGIYILDKKERCAQDGRSVNWC